MAKANFVGENALDRAVRLLERFNERFADPEVPGMQNIPVTLNRDGSGSVGELFDFDSLDELVGFLNAPVALQVQTIKDAA